MDDPAAEGGPSPPDRTSSSYTRALPSGTLDSMDRAWLGVGVALLGCLLYTGIFVAEIRKRRRLRAPKDTSFWVGSSLFHATTAEHASDSIIYVPAVTNVTIQDCSFTDPC